MPELCGKRLKQSEEYNNYTENQGMESLELNKNVLERQIRGRFFICMVAEKVDA